MAILDFNPRTRNANVPAVRINDFVPLANTVTEIAAIRRQKDREAQVRARQEKQDRQRAIKEARADYDEIVNIPYDNKVQFETIQKMKDKHNLTRSNLAKTDFLDQTQWASFYDRFDDFLAEPEIQDIFTQTQRSKVFREEMQKNKDYFGKNLDEAQSLYFDYLSGKNKKELNVADFRYHPYQQKIDEYFDHIVPQEVLDIQSDKNHVAAYINTIYGDVSQMASDAYNLLSEEDRNQMIRDGISDPKRWILQSFQQKASPSRELKDLKLRTPLSQQKRDYSGMPMPSSSNPHGRATKTAKDRDRNVPYYEMYNKYGLKLNDLQLDLLVKAQKEGKDIDDIFRKSILPNFDIKGPNGTEFNVPVRDGGTTVDFYGDYFALSDEGAGDSSGFEFDMLGDATLAQLKNNRGKAQEFEIKRGDGQYYLTTNDPGFIFENVLGKKLELGFGDNSAEDFKNLMQENGITYSSDPTNDDDQVRFKIPISIPGQYAGYKDGRSLQGHIYGVESSGGQLDAFNTDQRAIGAGQFIWQWHGDKIKAMVDQYDVDKPDLYTDIERKNLAPWTEKYQKHPIWKGTDKEDWRYAEAYMSNGPIQEEMWRDWRVNTLDSIVSTLKDMPEARGYSLEQLYYLAHHEGTLDNAMSFLKNGKSVHDTGKRSVTDEVRKAVSVVGRSVGSGVQFNDNGDPSYINKQAQPDQDKTPTADPGTVAANPNSNISNPTVSEGQEAQDTNLTLSFLQGSNDAVSPDTSSPEELETIAAEIVSGGSASQPPQPPQAASVGAIPTPSISDQQDAPQVSAIEAAKQKLEQAKSMPSEFASDKRQKDAAVKKATRDLERAKKVDLFRKAAAGNIARSNFENQLKSNSKKQKELNDKRIVDSRVEHYYEIHMDHKLEDFAENMSRLDPGSAFKPNTKRDISIERQLSGEVSEFKVTIDGESSIMSLDEVMDFIYKEEYDSDFMKSAPGLMQMWNEMTPSQRRLFSKETGIKF